MANKDVNGTVIIGSVFSLGNDNPFHFYDTEVPAELANGRENVLAVHRFSGDLRTIDSFGGHPEPITWSGTLLSINDIPQRGDRPAISAQLAANRSEALYELAKLRTPVKLQFHNYSWTGVIRNYKPVIHSVNKVTYTLTFEILSEDLRPQTQFLTYTPFSLPKNPFDDMLSQFMNFAKNAALWLRVAAAFLALTKLAIQQLKNDPGAFLFKKLQLIPGSAEYLEFVAAAENFVSSFENFRDNLFPQFVVDMENGKPYNTLDADAFTKVYSPQAKAIQDALANIQTYMLQHAAVSSLSDPAQTALTTTAVRDALNSIKLLRKTYQKVVTPKIARKLTIQNPDLYQLSALYYGDLQHWKIIARANALSDPKPPAGLYTLVIPDANINTDDYYSRSEV